MTAAAERALLLIDYGSRVLSALLVTPEGDALAGALQLARADDAALGEERVA